MVRTYEITLGKITGTNGIVCNNPTVKTDRPSCPTIVCDIEKDKNGGYKLKIQVPDECEDGCIDVLIDCNEECKSCGTQRITICPCETAKDCPGCQECGPDKYCISKCKPEEFCSGDKCVECDEKRPCPKGQVCESGKCVCPPNKPYKNQKGECVECNETTPLSPCQECVAGKIIEKKCPVGVVDPKTCDCVECVKGSDCKKPHEICVDRKCECEKGYRRNLVTGDCEPVPDCTTDEDCGPCRKCKENGKCGDMSCPEGYVPSNRPGECCVKKCDCNSPSCPPGHSCTKLANGECVCINCDVLCDNGKCPEGCACKDGRKCGTSPCSGKCINGVPCAPGCGCDEDDNCVECKGLPCTECAKIKGCNCNKPDNCETTPCKGKCVNGQPCAPGCGCDREDNCIDCNKFSCANGETCPEGCDCNDGVKCGKKDNPGGGDDDEQGPCTDTAKIIDNGDCTITAQLNMAGCCDCKDVYLHTNQTISGDTRIITGVLRIGANAGDAKLSQTGIVNDASITGSVKYTWEQTAREINNAGQIIVGGDQQIITTTATGQFNNSDTFSVSSTLKPNDSIITIGNKRYKIVETALFVETVGELRNTINECTYGLGRFLLYRKGGNDAGNYVVQVNKRQKCKTPIFVWYKSMDGQSWTEIKRVYSTRKGVGRYEDKLTKEHGLEVCKYFKFIADCGCAREAFYSCSGEGMTKYVIYQPKSLNIQQLDACGNSIKINEVSVCDTVTPETAPYKLYINGVLYGEYHVDDNGKLFAGGLTINYTDPIIEVKLEYPCDDCNKPLIYKFNTIIDCETCNDINMTLTASGNCKTGITVSGVVSKKSDPTKYHVGCEIKIVLDGKTYTTLSGTNGGFSINIPVTKNGTYTITATNCKGCTKTTTINITDCCALNLINASYDCVTKRVTTTVNGVPTIYLIHDSNGNVVSQGAYVSPINIGGGLANGNYEIEITDGTCTSKKSFSVGCGKPNFTVTAKCEGTQGKIVVSGYSGGSGAPYTVEYSTNNFTTIEGSGSTDPFTWDSEPGVTYYVRVKDNSGNISLVKEIKGLDCSVNDYNFTATMKCVGSSPRWCITTTKTGVGTVVIKDINNVTVYSGTKSFTANVEQCNEFTTAPSQGIATVSITIDGNTVTRQINITECATAGVSYDCATGLKVTGVSEFMVHSTGYPPGGYGPFTPSSTNLFFTDTTTGSRTLVIKSVDGTQTYGTITINCCDHRFTTEHDICVGNTPRMKLRLDGIAGTYSIRVYKNGTQVCDIVVPHSGGVNTYSIACVLESDTVYAIEVENQEYADRVYVEGNFDTCIVVAPYTSTNCGGGGTGGNGCDLTQSDITITGGCNPTITNNYRREITVVFVAVVEGDCLAGFGEQEGTAKTVPPNGGSVNYGAFAYPNLPHRVVVNYGTKTGDTGCPTVKFCYTGCNGSSSCTLTNDPVLECIVTSTGRAVKITNTNSEKVSWYANGVHGGTMASGEFRQRNYPPGTTVEVVFKCLKDLTKTRTKTITLDCI